MSSFDWNSHLSEEYGDEPFEASEGSGQTRLANLDGKIAINLGGATFYVVLPEKFSGSLSLLEKGAETAEERYKLTQLLQILKSRGDVVFVPADPSESSQSGPDVRRRFLAALKEREAVLASNLRQRLRGGAA